MSEIKVVPPDKFKIETCDCGALWLEIMKMTHRAGCPHHPQTPKQENPEPIEQAAPPPDELREQLTEQILAKQGYRHDLVDEGLNQCDGCENGAAIMHVLRERGIFEPAAPAAIEQARPQAPAAILRCRLTNNPCGTDTRPNGTVCLCPPCCEWRAVAAESAPERTQDVFTGLEDADIRRLIDEIRHAEYSVIFAAIKKFRVRAVAVPEPAAQRRFQDFLPLNQFTRLIREMFIVIHDGIELPEEKKWEWLKLLNESCAAPERGDSKC